jgi:glutathione S-transferase
MIHLYRFARSLNVERVALALAHKRLPVESVWVDPEDRNEVERVSGQKLVPVIEDDGKVIHDSMEIVLYLEERYPQLPLYPAEPDRGAETLIFIDWFNRVWKRAPNEIDAEITRPSPDAARIERFGKSMQDALALFEGLLTRREYLMGEFSAADCAAFPFLKMALLGHGGSTYRFHHILVRYQQLGNDYPALSRWIRRVDQHPRV